jgi:hypothetical protein
LRRWYLYEWNMNLLPKCCLRSARIQKSRQKTGPISDLFLRGFIIYYVILTEHVCTRIIVTRWGYKTNYLSMALQAFVGPLSLCSFLILYTISRTPWTGDQPVATPLPTHRTTQTQNKRTQTSIPWLGFEPTIPAFERAKTVHALDRAATVIGDIWQTFLKIPGWLKSGRVSTCIRKVLFLNFGLHIDWELWRFSLRENHGILVAR